MFINKNAIIALLGAVALLGVSSAPALSAEGHFDSKGKLPSRHTIDSQQQQLKSLPFADKRDFEEQKKQFLANFYELPLDKLVIRKPHNWGGLLDIEGIEKIDKKKSKLIPCTFPWYSLTIFFIY